MKSVTTYLYLNGHCREAMSFYRTCLGSERHPAAVPGCERQALGRSGAPIMHPQSWRAGAPVLMASDSSPEGPAHQGNDFLGVYAGGHTVAEATVCLRGTRGATPVRDISLSGFARATRRRLRER